MSVFGAIAYGMINVLHPRMLWLMLWPVLVALVLWGALAAALWTRIALRLAGVLQHWLESAAFFLHFNFSDVALVAAHVLLFLLFVPMVYLTALVILGVFGMQAMVDHVARRSYPELERHGRGAFVGSAWNVVIALAGMLLLGLVTLPLWLVPPLWPLIPVAIMGWVNQRLLRYDALAEHAAVDERARLFRHRRGALYLMGVLMALVAYIPIVGFFAPVVFGLAFIDYLLGALQVERALK